MGPLRPGGVYLILNLVVLDVAVGWNFMTFPKSIRSNISEVILNKNAYGWGGVSLAFFLPLCRPARAFEARFLGLHGRWVKADRCSESDRFGSSKA